MKQEAIFKGEEKSGRTQAFEQTFHTADITTPKMKAAIAQWFSIYFDAQGEDTCQRIAVRLVNKCYKATFGGYQATISCHSSKAAFMKSCLYAIEQRRTKAMQFAMVGGECLIKPIPDPRGKRMRFVLLRRDSYLPLARDENGRMTSVGTMDTTAAAGYFYTLMERRSVDENGYLTIESKLFQSQISDAIGRQVPLATLEKYAQMQDRYTFPKPVWNLGLVPLRMPIENMVDGSDDAVSLYAAAVGLISRVNQNERQRDKQFEQSKCHKGTNKMESGTLDGKKVIDDLSAQISDKTSDCILNPALCTQSYLACKQAYLRDIESLIGLKRGMLSNVDTISHTINKAASPTDDENLTIFAFQRAWQDMLCELLQTCDILGQMYGLCDEMPFDTENVVIRWNSEGV